MIIEQLEGTEIKEIKALEIICITGKPRSEGNESDLISVLGEEQLCLPPYQCVDSELIEICNLWNTLPYGEQARCHIPGYALRIRVKDEIQLVATICWECNNIHLSGSKCVERCREFDGSSEIAQRMLKLCQSKFT
ncbi:MAG: hypothetical protein COA78_06500 [Blastopirellula sp.]|nr:MAG: hypothetical protein COA78_06500 [Blastopirellula sp.]